MIQATWTINLTLHFNYQHFRDLPIVAILTVRLVIRLPKLKDLDQKIPTFPNCDNYGTCRSSNSNLASDDVKLDDNALHQQICSHFKVDYLEEMDIIKQTKRRIE